MAGDDGTTMNNEILGARDGAEEGQATSTRGELHSRVGGILECDPPGNRNSSNERAAAADDNEDGVCRYAVGAANRAMSFFEMCQVSAIKLVDLFAPVVGVPNYQNARRRAAFSKLNIRGNLLSNSYLIYIYNSYLTLTMCNKRYKISCFAFSRQDMSYLLDSTSTSLPAIGPTTTIQYPRRFYRIDCGESGQ